MKLKAILTSIFSSSKSTVLVWIIVFYNACNSLEIIYRISCYITIFYFNVCLRIFINFRRIQQQVWRSIKNIFFLFKQTICELSSTFCFLVKAADLSWKSWLFSAFESHQSAIIRLFSLNFYSLSCERHRQIARSRLGGRPAVMRSIRCQFRWNLLCIIATEGLLLLSILLKRCKHLNIIKNLTKFLYQFSLSFSYWINP